VWDVRAVTDPAFCGRMSNYHCFFIQFSSFPHFQVFPHLPTFSPSYSLGENVIIDMRLSKFWVILYTKMKYVNIKIKSPHATVAAPGSL
jgi:hypothetical protein